MTRGRGEHVRRPAVVFLVVVPIRSDHHRVAVDRHADAEQVTPSAVARGQLGALQVLDTTAACGLRQSSKAPDGRDIGLRACRDREDRTRRDDQHQKRQDDERRASPARMESQRRRPTAAGSPPRSRSIAAEATPAVMSRGRRCFGSIFAPRGSRERFARTNRGVVGFVGRQSRRDRQGQHPAALRGSPSVRRVQAPPGVSRARRRAGASVA